VFTGRTPAFRAVSAAVPAFNVDFVAFSQREPHSHYSAGTETVRLLLKIAADARADESWRGRTQEPNDISGNQERKQSNHVETEPGWTELPINP
jgi:hypothetical protein